MSSQIQGSVSLRICEQDGITPFDERPITIGTRLVIYVDSDSNSAAGTWVGALDLLKPSPEPVIPIGRFSAEIGILNDLIISGRHFAAAGDNARVIDWENQDQQSFEFSAAGSYKDAMQPGTWFVIDYNAVTIGNVTIDLVEYQDEQMIPVFQRRFIKLQIVISIMIKR